MHKGGLTIKYRSPQQEHSFGYPYQLGHHGSADRPEDAMLITLPVRVPDYALHAGEGCTLQSYDSLSGS